MFTDLITRVDVSLLLEFKQCLVQACLLLLQELVETGEVRLQVRVTFGFK